MQEDKFVILWVFYIVKQNEKYHKAKIQIFCCVLSMEKLSEINKTWRFKLERNVDNDDVESLYLLACITGEAGELANLGKKIFQRNYLNHDRLNLIDDKIKKEEMQEIGDILYYLYKYAAHRGIDIEEAWKLTMSKNMKRYTKS